MSTAAPALPVSTKNVLVVDDNRQYRELVSLFLEKNSYRVSQASRGEEALEMLGRQKPDVMLLDLHLPGKNGFEILQEIRGPLALRKIPVILISGSPILDRMRGIYLDASELLHKSIPLEKILESVRKAAEGAEPEQAAAFPETREKNNPEEAPAPAAMTEEMEQEETLELIQDDEEKKKQEVDIHQLEILANDSPVIQLVNQIFLKAVKMQASDIHIEPQADHVTIRFRLNGNLRLIRNLPAAMQARLSARIKILSNLIVTERRLPQDGQFQASIHGERVEFRISILPSVYGEKIVIRILGQGKIKSSIELLEMTPRDLLCARRAIQAPHGLVLVTGPTGSGKTTTLYTFLKQLNCEDINIMTAEDPVEYRLPGITQVPINNAIGLNFNAVLRSFLRQDPDVMLVGEIRDLETAEIAAKASITGHLVLSTLHTNSAPATVTRLINMGLAPYMVAASLKLVVAQRLIRVLCPSCKIPGQLNDEDRKMLSKEETQILDAIFRPKGCPKCQSSGYLGRKAVFEVMPVSSVSMRQLILSEGSMDDLLKQAVQEGMTSLRQAAVQMAGAGETSMQEVYRILLAD